MTNPIREQIRSLLRVEPRDGGFRSHMHVDPALRVLPDHFRGYPLLPGICMMQAVVLSGAVCQGVPDFRIRAMKNAKMMLPVRPGDHLVIDADMIPNSDGNFQIKAKLSSGEKRCAEFSLVVGP